MGDRFSSSLLDPSKTDTREIDQFAVFILTEYLMLLEDLEFREIKSSKNADLGIYLYVIVMIPASHEGCHGTSTMYLPIMSHH